MIRVVGLDYIGVVVDYNYDFDYLPIIESAARCAEFKSTETEMATKLWEEHIREHQFSQSDAVRAFGEYFAKLRGRISTAKFEEFSNESDRQIAFHLYLLREESRFVLTQLYNRGIKIAITTHIPRREVVEISLNTHGLRHCVWRIYTSTGRDKVTGELYRRLLDDAAQVGIGPDNVLIVDDKEANLRALVALGCTPVLLKRNASIESRAIDIKWVIANLSEILDLLEDSEGAD